MELFNSTSRPLSKETHWCFSSKDLALLTASLPKTNPFASILLTTSSALRKADQLHLELFTICYRMLFWSPQLVERPKDWSLSSVLAYLWGPDQWRNHVKYFPLQFMTSEHQYISRKDEGDRVVLDSDDSLFGGFSRIDHKAEYFTFEGQFDNRPRSFMVYAPSRTAVVYRLTECEVEKEVELVEE
ncbi:hypothetical protein RJ639_002154 [Escallonia herrerae]|uniref:Alpha-amylase/branching enzyme C-terminal all beta domain-containing protein n=1 Tax=Escallonia herrerae TaxID=1293975 RepID=A0AA89BIG5_9ASTE|nr:hypothetical protein RJ639_002154 [Escallonia herrerae]